MSFSSKHHRRKSSSSDDDPFDTPENYYGASTNPSQAPKNLRLGRVRTFLVFETKSRAGIFDDFKVPSHSGVENPIKEEPLRETTPFSAKSPTPEPMAEEAVARRGSIVPLYGNLSNESLEGNQERIESHIDKQLYNTHFRRASVDDTYIRPKRFYINDIELTLRELLENEDTDHNYQITIDDNGPKTLALGTANSNGFKQQAIRGTYMLSNLLQELTIAKRFGRNQMILDEARLAENPVKRMRRLISTLFWKALTRTITRDNILEMARDVKIQEEYTDEKGEFHRNKESCRIYIPHNRKDQYDYFHAIKDANPDAPIDIQYLPEKIDAEFIKSINKKPGLLLLALQPDPNDATNLLNEPYVVPGGRFNELYGWDSYMMVVGLLVDVTPENQLNLKLSRGMTENFIYEIDHYGKILNANRSYYLGRSQPPFLTDMALRVYYKSVEVSGNKEDLQDFLRRATVAAIKEYLTVWTSKPRLDEELGLSCYHPEGVGIPPETEASHFNSILAPYVQKHEISQAEFIEKYNNKEIHEPELDEYFLHDRAVRESGHDTSYRLEGKAAHLATVDLNSLLYKYEVDIAFIIEKFFDGALEDCSGKTHTAAQWRVRAATRRDNITKHLWNEKESMFYDYNVKTKEQTGYESATAFWPLWSEAATKEQAEELVNNSLSKFEEEGGLVSGTLKSRGDLGIHRPSRQWDYPFGWAPQQILAWVGLSNYGYESAARRLVYRWLFMLIRAFVDYNGVVVEKYNVLEGAVPHKVEAEYGNQGSDFKGVATEGFGWVNASFLFGLTFLNVHAQRNLGTLTPPGVFLRNLHPDQRKLYI